MTEPLIRKALHALGIASLNEVQQSMLTHFPTTENIVLLSPTGSGKTLAFLLPLLTRLNPEATGIQALIITPSRELALQIETVFRAIGSGWRVCCCYGGHDILTEKRSLLTPPALLIGTPGRLLDHLDHKNIDLGCTDTVILDEYDKIVEFGFHEELREITACMHGVKHRVLTSATETVEIPSFVGLSHPLVLNFLTPSDSTRLTTFRVEVAKGEKDDALYRLIATLQGAPTLVFCNFREKAEQISHFLHEKGVENECFHGGLEQDERERALCKFRNGSTYLLVSTDLASRGLDIPEIRCIIHCQLPSTEEAYTHRNGRTARVNATGTAFLLHSPDERLPEYIGEPELYTLSTSPTPPPPPEWATLYIGRGKKEKLSKTDIVGFLCQKGKLTVEEIGRIELKDYHAFVAIKRGKIKPLLSRIRDEKIKNKKTTFALSM